MGAPGYTVRMARWKPTKSRPLPPLPSKSKAATPEDVAPEAGPFPSAPNAEDLSGAPEAGIEADAKVGRSLSRVFAGLSQEDLRPVVERILRQAADGDTQAQALFLRLESLLASKPVDDRDTAAIKPVHVEAAENALAALAKKIGAKYPDGSCPYCGRGAEE